MEMKTLKDQVADWKREQILRVASELFYTKGFSRTSMDDIASTLAIGKPMIYSYFPSKIALLAAVCNQTSHLVASLAETIAKADAQSPAQLMHSIIYEVSLRIVEGSQPLAVLFREVKHLPPSSLAQLKHSDTRFREIMIDILRQGKAAGEFHYEADERVIAQSISGMLTWLFTWYRDSGPLRAEEVAEQMALIVLQTAGCVASEALGEK